MKRGRFIAIEGTDGSGKTVQFERLILALPEGARVATLDFPRYGDPAAYGAEKYLTGKYGGDVGPYAASVLFAADRFDAKLKLEEWLREGRFVVANRYVASSMAYQGAKIAEKIEREYFYKWLYQLEYEIFGIPKPDLCILLHVPAEIARGQLARRGVRAALAAGHGGGRDIHEEDPAYQKRAEEVYLEIAALFPRDFTVIECATGGVSGAGDAGGAMLPPDKIHEKIMAVVRR